MYEKYSRNLLQICPENFKLLSLWRTPSRLTRCTGGPRRETQVTYTLHWRTPSRDAGHLQAALADPVERRRVAYNSALANPVERLGSLPRCTGGLRQETQGHLHAALPDQVERHRVTCTLYCRTPPRRRVTCTLHWRTPSRDERLGQLSDNLRRWLGRKIGRLFVSVFGNNLNRLYCVFCVMFPEYIVVIIN